MKIFLKKYFKLFLILLIPSIIIFSWFKEGKIISNTTEEELSIYNSQRTAKINSGFWNPTGVGYSSPFPLARFPIFFVLSIFQYLGVPAFLNQALLFWLLMVVGVLSMFFLLREVFRFTNGSALIGGFFYLLNIYSMTQVWKRMLYHGMFAWAYLPLFIFLWIKWINSKKILWLFTFLITSLLFSYVFSQPAFIITLWTPAGIFVLVRVWQSKHQINEITRVFLRMFVGFMLWGLVNIWWLYPMLTLGSTWTEITGQTWKSDLSSLQAVSKYFPIWEVLLLRQSWYLSSDNDFGNYYQNPFIILISVLIFLIVAFAILKLKNYPYRGFVLSLAFISFFISKGTSFPLGYSLFYVLFLTIPFSVAFRNSYEKFGIVWLLTYTILFTFGFAKLLSLLKARERYFISGVILSSIIILVFPFWSGEVFPQRHRINVPNYYNDANNYLKQRSEDRLFHLPFTLELENSSYTWGFIGGDPTHVLFDLEPITKPKVPLYYKVAAFLPNFLSDKNFPKVLGWLGVGNVILHKDNIYPKINIEETTKIIEDWEGIKDKKNIGELVIYSLDKALVNLRVYTTSSTVSVLSIQEGLNKIISNEIDPRKVVFIIGDNSSLPSLMQNDIKMDFKKISNDQYIAQVKSAKIPFILVLNNTFDKLWQAKIDKQIIDKHFIVNGFANGWLIEKTGDYLIDIKLKVWPWD